MSRQSQLGTHLQNIRRSTEQLNDIWRRSEQGIKCKEECWQLLQLLHHEYKCGKHLESRVNGPDAPSLDDFEQQLKTLEHVADAALKQFQECCKPNSGFWRITSSPRQELRKLIEKLCRTPLDPVQAAVEIDRPEDSNGPFNPTSPVLLISTKTEHHTILWVTHNHTIERHRNTDVRHTKVTYPWPPGAAVTAFAVSKNTGHFWTGHQSGGVAVNSPGHKRFNPNPVSASGHAPLTAPITAIALYESTNPSDASCDAWVGDSRGNILILRRERDPGAQADASAYLLHPVGGFSPREGQGAPVTALLVHHMQVLVAMGGRPATLRLLPASMPENGRSVQHLQELHSVEVPEPINHIVVLPDHQGQPSLNRSFHVITASNAAVTEGLSVWCIARHNGTDSFHLVARLCPPPPNPGAPSSLPPVRGIHISPDNRLLVTVHNDDTPLRIWALPSILDEIYGPRDTPRDAPRVPPLTPAIVRLPFLAVSIRHSPKDQVLASCSDAERVIVARATGVVRAWLWEWLLCYAEVHSVLDRQVEAPSGRGLLSSLPSYGLPAEAPAAAAGGQEAGAGGVQGAAGGVGGEGAPEGFAMQGEQMPPRVRKEDLVWTKEGLGEGSFGDVALAEFQKQRVAVKMLRMGGTEEAEVERLMKALLREVQHLSRMVFCQRFVRVVGWCPAPPMIITEYYPKRSLDFQLRKLREAMQAGALPDTLPPHHIARWDVRLRIAQLVAAGMYSAHEMEPPLIHGDLRSANIMLDSMCQPFIGDLGQSLLLGGDAGHHTTHPKTAAPELSTVSAPDTKSDVWSMGVILWELLMCDVPHRDVHTMRFLGLASEGQAPGLKIPGRADWGRLPLADRVKYDGVEDYTELIKACLHPNPDERPKFERIATDLKSIINQPKFRRVGEMLQKWIKTRKIALSMLPSSQLGASIGTATTAGPSTASTAGPSPSTSHGPSLSSSPESPTTTPLHHPPPPPPPPPDTLPTNPNLPPSPLILHPSTLPHPDAPAGAFAASTTTSHPGAHGTPTGGLTQPLSELRLDRRGPAAAAPFTPATQATTTTAQATGLRSPFENPNPEPAPPSPNPHSPPAAPPHPPPPAAPSPPPQPLPRQPLSWASEQQNLQPAPRSPTPQPPGFPTPSLQQQYSPPRSPFDGTAPPGAEVPYTHQPSSPPRGSPLNALSQHPAALSTQQTSLAATPSPSPQPQPPALHPLTIPSQIRNAVATTPLNPHAPQAAVPSPSVQLQPPPRQPHASPDNHSQAATPAPPHQPSTSPRPPSLQAVTTPVHHPHPLPATAAWQHTVPSPFEAQQPPAAVPPTPINTPHPLPATTAWEHTTRSSLQAQQPQAAAPLTPNATATPSPVPSNPVVTHNRTGPTASPAPSHRPQQPQPQPQPQVHIPVVTDTRSGPAPSRSPHPISRLRRLDQVMAQDPEYFSKERRQSRRASRSSAGSISSTSSTASLPPDQPAATTSLGPSQPALHLPPYLQHAPASGHLTTAAAGLPAEAQASTSSSSLSYTPPAAHFLNGGRFAAPATSRPNDLVPSGTPLQGLDTGHSQQSTLVSTAVTQALGPFAVMTHQQHSRPRPTPSPAPGPQGHLPTSNQTHYCYKRSEPGHRQHLQPGTAHSSGSPTSDAHDQTLLWDQTLSGDQDPSRQADIRPPQALGLQDLAPRNNALTPRVHPAVAPALVVPASPATLMPYTAIASSNSGMATSAGSTTTAQMGPHPVDLPARASGSHQPTDPGTSIHGGWQPRGGPFFSQAQASSSHQPAHAAERSFFTPPHLPATVGRPIPNPNPEPPVHRPHASPREPPAPAAPGAQPFPFAPNPTQRRLAADVFGQPPPSVRAAVIGTSRRC